MTLRVLNYHWGHEAVSSRIIYIHDFRADILPTIVKNWEELADIEKKQITRMNNFFVVCTT